MCTSLIRPSSLERLPNEILQSISDVLDDVSAVCLKNTNSTLRSRINRDSTSFSRCTKWLIMCRFESDLLKNIPWERQPEKVTCAFCKVKRTKAQIIGRGSGRKGVNFSTFSRGRWHVPSTNRYCAKHPVFITWVKPAPGHHVPTTWVMTRRLTCSHCEARVDSSDARITGCAECQCDVCPRVCRALFTRYGALPKAARAGRPYIEGLWWQTHSGKVYISEFGKLFPICGSKRYAPEDETPSPDVPEYNGNLSDVSPWECTNRYRAKLYRVLKSFIEDHYISGGLFVD